MNNFKEIKLKELGLDPFKIRKEWMLITAEKDGKVNTMTASWGGFGIMWDKQVAFIVIRPQRYTKEFVDNADSFSLTFFDSVYKKQLAYLGKMSGKYEDKISEVEFTITHDQDVPYFKEAEAVIIANKLYSQEMKEESFIQKDIIDHWFPSKDFHILYVAEITKVLIKE